MEFHACHHAALRLAGTVPLPSPFPASGPVSVVATRDGQDVEIYVKILQVVGDRRIITRFVRPEDIRAIRARPRDGTPGGPETWPIHGIKQVGDELEQRAKELIDKAKKGAFEEAAWYAAAIVYVVESAPVLHRNEIGVTAAVSAEEVWFVAPQICCNPGGGIGG
jgi:hypothetical protein